MTRDVRVYPDAHALARAVARALVEVLGTAGAAADRCCSVVLAGGNTPRILYGLLGSVYRDAIPWEHVHVYWGDERCVPPDDPRSNFRLAKEAWLDRIAIPLENVHPMPTDLPDADAAARRYEATMRARFPAQWPVFDLALLGIGTDAHTASLFPGSPALDETTRWVVATRAPGEPHARLTLTLPVLNHAARVWFLVAGADKAPALRRIFADVSAPARAAAGIPPAAAVGPHDGTLTWWVDAAAASLLSPRARGE